MGVGISGYDGNGIGTTVGSSAVGAGTGTPVEQFEVAFATQPVVESTQSQQAPHQGYEPLLLMQ